MPRKSKFNVVNVVAGVIASVGLLATIGCSSSTSESTEEVLSSRESVSGDFQAKYSGNAESDVANAFSYLEQAVVREGFVNKPVIRYTGNAESDTAEAIYYLADILQGSSAERPVVNYTGDAESDIALSIIHLAESIESQGKGGFCR